MSPRPNFRGRLRPALIFELGRIGSEHLPNDLPRDPKLPADRLDRPLLNEIRPADLRNRLHDQHPELGLHVPWKPVWTLIPGVPFGCRSPRKRGPYSTPIHILILEELSKLIEVSLAVPVDVVGKSFVKYFANFVIRLR